MRSLLLQWGNANAKPNGPNAARTRMLDNTTDSGPKVATAVTAGDAVGLPPPHVPRRRWYIAIVGNNSEKLCGQRLLKLFAEWQKYGKDCEVYVPIQRVLRRLGDSGRRTYVERVVLPTYVFVRCTEAERRRDIAYLPFVKRFFVNIAGAPVNGHRPVATIPDAQMACLRRMIEGASLPVTVSDRPVRSVAPPGITSSTQASVPSTLPSTWQTLWPPRAAPTRAKTSDIAHNAVFLILQNRHSRPFPSVSSTNLTISSPRRSRATMRPSGSKRIICGMPVTP